MKQAAFVRAGEILSDLERIAKARQCWTKSAYLSMLADLTGVDVTQHPKDALKIPAITSFQKTAMEKLESDEALLRREFDSL